MKCQHCGQEMEPVNHNNRGWRCSLCWGLLPEVTEKPKQPQEEPEVKTVPHPKPKPAPRVTRPKKAPK